jgi:membrane protein YqaA with SNARE-associated domain
MPELPDDSIFISYSRRDSEIMQRIVLYLRDQGFKVWVDNERLVPGTAIWEEEIEKAIKASSTVLIIMSPDSKNSEWVRREISLADQYRKHIMPVLVRGDEDSSVTLRLATRQFVDLRQNEDKGLKSLHNALFLYRQNNKTQQDKNVVENPIEHEVSDSPLQRKEKTLQPVYQRDTGRISATNEWNKVFLFALGWLVAGGIGGFAYSSISIDVLGDVGNELFGGLVGGFIGGLVVMAARQSMGSDAPPKSLASLLTSWTLGGALGWVIGFELTEAIGAGIGMVVFVIAGLAGTYGFKYITANVGSVIGIATAWFLGEAFGWLVARRWMLDSLDIDQGTSWAVGTALAWAIGGFVLGWQMFKVKVRE